MGPISFDRADLEPYPISGMTISACLLRPKSRGSVEIRTADLRLASRIDAGYIDDRRDMDLPIEALETVRRIAATRPLADFIEAPHAPLPSVRTAGETESWIRQTALKIYHPAGTCTMGPGTRTDLVVDERLRVHRSRSLRMVDASIMPTIVSGKPNGPCVMLGEHAARMIKDDWSL